MHNTTYALIVAAGEGRRAGLVEGTLKKQFASVSGCPVIIHTLTAFQRSPSVDTLICVIAREDRDYFDDLLQRYSFSKLKAVVDGGACRQGSVAAGLFFLKGCCSDQDIVLVHDGVRPLVSQSLIARVIAAAMQYGGAVSAWPVTDSLKEVSSQLLIQRSLPRETIWAMQTPQGFRFGLLMTAMEKAVSDGFIGTDEAALVERVGAPIFCVEGAATNVKITTGSDLHYVETLLKTDGI